MKEEIIQKLSEYNKEQGVIFTSEDDAINYYKGLIELLESIKCGGDETGEELNNLSEKIKNI